MISLIIATSNRAYTLKKVADSFFRQADVDELIFVFDGCRDDSVSIVEQISRAYPDKKLVSVINPERLGQAESRNRGIAMATNEYLLFCDDDEYLEKDYARVCLKKLRDYNAGVVAGRRIYMRENESAEEAKVRFGNGLRHVRPFNYILCEYINAARFEGDIAVPLTNSVMMTRRDHALSHPFDPHYSNGNGYREESDFQMRLFLAGFQNYTTNDVHSFHLPPVETRTGGQRVSLWRRVAWSCRYTSYFFGKFYRQYARKTSLWTPRFVALGLYSVFAFYKEFLRPPMRDAFVAMARRLDVRA